MKKGVFAVQMILTALFLSCNHCANKNIQINFWSDVQNEINILSQHHLIQDTFVVDTNDLTINLLKPYPNIQLIISNYSKIEQSTYPYYGNFDSVSISCYIYKSLVKHNGFDREIILMKKYIYSNILPVSSVYFILTRKDSNFISSFLLAENVRFNGKEEYCSSIIFSDTLILRRRWTHSISDYQIEDDPTTLHKSLKTGLFVFDKYWGKYILIKSL